MKNDWEDGPYLVYDCVAKHWVCTSLSGKLSCEVRRSFWANYVKDGPHSQSLGCAVVGHFSTPQVCYKWLAWGQDQAREKSFCFKRFLKKNVVKKTLVRQKEIKE